LADMDVVIRQYGPFTMKPTDSNKPAKTVAKIIWIVQEPFSGQRMAYIRLQLSEYTFGV